MIDTIMLSVHIFTEKYQEITVNFLKAIFIEDNREFNLAAREKDLINISDSYMKKGCFWLLLDDGGEIQGTIGIFHNEDYSEIRRFFVSKKYQNKGYGKKLLQHSILFAVKHNFNIVRLSVQLRSLSAQKILLDSGFKRTISYKHSTADCSFELKIGRKEKYEISLNQLKDQFENTLILNPTENIPMYDNRYDASFLEGLYISDNKRNSKDKVIFAGRNEYIDFFHQVKNEWNNALASSDVDLKTLSGLQAHMIFFMSVLEPKDIVMILPESCGGHYCTERILKNIGANVVLMKPDLTNHCIDVAETKKIIEALQPAYIFVDRSEGLYFEDFSWLKQFNNSCKIFDASQYLTQIITKEYQNPFEMGFDIILTTLHKNYPGPQKGLLCTSSDSKVWRKYINESKTYFSNTHPRSIALSMLPMLNLNELGEYSKAVFECSLLLEKELIALNIPIMKRDSTKNRTIHTWLLGGDNYDIYNYYLKLELLGFLTNYRLLPYDLGYGLRIGTNAAVRSGLKNYHIKPLAKILAQAYYNEICSSLKQDAYYLIRDIKCSIVK